jgi:hypothetical protein
MRPTQLAYLAIALWTALPGNDCDFVERCRGNVRQTCGGVDQCIGRRLEEEPCVAPNDACVAEGLRAWCVRAPATRCASTEPGRCEGARVVRCAAGYVVVEDCAAVRNPDGSSAELT